ncbi:MAG: hypothetical protein K0V04_19180 [Deltaproteobacteria bacterium]|nr:hypothetical protein [Deltaproteobacteria bacterium]
MGASTASIAPPSAAEGGDTDVADDDSADVRSPDGDARSADSGAADGDLRSADGGSVDDRSADVDETTVESNAMAAHVLTRW